MIIDLIGRVCKNEVGEYDMDNIQLYTRRQLIDEYTKIDYLDKDEVDEIGIDNIEAMDLNEVAKMNDEYLVFTQYHKEDTNKYSIFLDKTENTYEIMQKINNANITVGLREGSVLDVSSEDIATVRHILNKLNIVYDIVSLTT